MSCEQKFPATYYRKPWSTQVHSAFITFGWHPVLQNKLVYKVCIKESLTILYIYKKNVLRKGRSPPRAATVHNNFMIQVIIHEQVCFLQNFVSYLHSSKAV